MTNKKMTDEEIDGFMKDNEGLLDDLAKQEELEKAAIESANNMGAARDAFHPDYGQILKDGEMTEAGKKFYEECIIPTLGKEK